MSATDDENATSAPAAERGLQLHGLTLVQDAVPHLAEVTLTLEYGRLHAVVGRTMAGKTTLLRVIAGLQPIDGGEMLLDGQPFGTLAIWERDVAMVYQEFINYPHLSVLDNVAFPLRRRGSNKAEARERAAEQLARVGLTGFEKRRPSQLSGGQQQRVALARALNRGARILLLDEPLVNLDYKLREQLREEFRELFSETGDTIVVYTTTEPAEAVMLGDEVIVMHQGRVVQVGPPGEVFEQPGSVTVAGIINDPPMNVLRGQLSAGVVDLPGITSFHVPERFKAVEDGSYLFGVRPDEVRLDAEGLAGTVVFSEVSGSETFVHVDAGEVRIVVQLEGVHVHHIGDELRLALDARDLFMFSRDGRLISSPNSAGARR